jgi:hypothetical protein
MDFSTLLVMAGIAVYGCAAYFRRERLFRSMPSPTGESSMPLGARPAGSILIAACGGVFALTLLSGLLLLASELADETPLSLYAAAGALSLMLLWLAAAIVLREAGSQRLRGNPPNRREDA